MRAPVYYNVAPRFTCGSPAQVPFDTAARVADQECAAFERLKDEDPGHVDVVRKDAAAGIVEERTERTDHWDITDMVTGERFIRMFPLLGARRVAAKKVALQRRYPNLRIEEVRA
jgi:hypothetical protein